MGQQQLLLIVLGLIIVGIAIAAGIVFFRERAIDTKRDKMIDDCVILASMAQAYYQKPTMFGGGGRTFAGWTIPTDLQSTASGVYSIEQINDNPPFVFIRAVGSEMLTSGDPVEVTIKIEPMTYQVSVVH